MKYYCLINICIAIIFVSCCECEKPNAAITSKYYHSDFITTIELTPIDTIEPPSYISPEELYIIKDSLVLVSNENPGMANKVSLYSLKNWNLINEFAKRGHAETEFIDCSIIFQGDYSNYFYLEDIQKNRYWVCNIDSLVRGSNCVNQGFTYSRDVINVYPLDSTYIGFNFWYLNDGKYNNHVSAIDRLPMKYGNRERLSKKYDYFVANVTGGVIFKNPINDDIWVAYKKDNRIEIYDCDLKIKRILLGPEHKRPQYNSIEKNGRNMVYFRNKSYMSCFSQCIFTEKHVYLLYENLNCVQYNSVPQPVEILVFDWNGNPVCNYKLDKYAYAISIDSHEQYLYATSCNSYSGEAIFLKYKLK